MNDKTQILKIVGSIGLFLTLIYGLFKFKGPDVSQDQIQSTIEVDSTNSVSNQQQDTQEQYDAQIQELNDSIIKLKFRLYDYEQLIQNTNDKTNEKVNTIVNTDAQQLVEFLSNRYKDSIK